jgi:dihydrodipicolinate synthase/N-acetylneuraminate lyase
LSTTLDPVLSTALRAGLAIPASPLALTAQRKLDERRQRALSRYYIAAGVGGIAVGVHTTQFAIREPKHGLYKPVLALAAEEMRRADGRRAAAGAPGSAPGSAPLLKVCGVSGRTQQAVAEVELARGLGYDTALVSLAALSDATDDVLIEHCKRVAAVIPVFGFYLQPSVGGRPLPYRFWRRFAEIDNVAAVKIAPFNRYATLDVVRAIAESGRDDIALYTGNDDSIVADLLTTFRFMVNGKPVERRMVGGLLGHWSVWTRGAVESFNTCRRAAGQQLLPAELLRLGMEITDANAAFFDSANGYAGCIAGLHEVLRRQGLFEGTWCLDPAEAMSPGQADEISRVSAAYPHLSDDRFVEEHRAEWLSG